ncbi:hypothetical protein ACNAN0_08180 [Agrilactobacillus fermenti]|uniref:hypothetical protein n=1 Tax=Agrilactobacillus fermenti TaxID=2586909 RepID=UPI001E28F7EB|nr:hypothetical protein [Agrilactobacillus fermenti]MCD2257138.1 hypothetical protein [Agrilactobacillus fermenti]
MTHRQLEQLAKSTESQYRQQMLAAVGEALPLGVHIVGVNFAHDSVSSYWLLSRQKGQHMQWLTLRIANHPSWLKNAQQIEVIWSQFDHPGNLMPRIRYLLARTDYEVPWFRLDSLSQAILQYCLFLERKRLVWYIRLPIVIAQHHKQRPIDLKTDFPKAHLLLGDRNNPNKGLKCLDSPDFQSRLGQLYGQNLLFSQFSSHQLLALLPTNQWVQKILQQMPFVNSWRQILRKNFGIKQF